MSPLLYQLSYTARAAKLTTYGDRVKRGGGTVPEIVPVSHLARGVLKIGRGDNVVAIEHCARRCDGDHAVACRTVPRACTHWPNFFESLGCAHLEGGQP